MTVGIAARLELKAACLALLDEVAIEHPSGHQGKYAARYVLRNQNGDRIGLMFEKAEKTRPYLWVEHSRVRDLLDVGVEFRTYPATGLYQPVEEGQKASYGRHAALKSMRELAHADLVRINIRSVEQLKGLVEKLLAEGGAE